MRFICSLSLGLFGALVPLVDDRSPEKPNTLTRQEAMDGWALLFDGRTTAGWKVQGDVRVEHGALVVGGAQASAVNLEKKRGYCNLRFDVIFDDAKDAKLTLNGYAKGRFIHAAPPGTKGWCHFFGQTMASDISVWTSGTKGFGVQGNFPDRTDFAFYVPAGQKLRVRNIKVKNRLGDAGPD